MLVTFKSKSYANITMLGNIGMDMLEMMNFGTNVPGGIVATDLAEAEIRTITLTLIRGLSCCRHISRDVTSDSPLEECLCPMT